MKLQLLFVLCICLVQTCFGWDRPEMTPEIKNVLKNKLHDQIGDISERFYGDILKIIDTAGDVVEYPILPVTIFEPLEKIRVQEKIPKVDVNSIRKYATERAHEMSAERVAYLIDFLKTYQSIWSKRLSSEIANGMTNLIYAIMSANATTVHIENAVKYLYSNETFCIKDPFRDVPDPNATECPTITQRLSTVQDKLKSMTDIKPSVLQDVAIIIEKFPCNPKEVPEFLENLVQIIRKLQSLAKVDGKPMGACVIKENSKYLKQLDYTLERDGVSHGGRITRDEINYELTRTELILSTRLTDEHFRSLINFEKAAIAEMPIEEIQKALEYVFVDVAAPVTICSSAEQ